MQCAIYKGQKKLDTYLYVEKENDFSRVPKSLLAMLGSLRLVMTLELTPEQKLARANTTHVLAELSERGYYLQLPPEE